MRDMEAFAGFFLVAAFLAAVAFYVFCVWVAYTKMGEAGWKGIVPFVSNWVLAEHTVGAGWKMFLMLIPLIGQLYALYAMYRWYVGFGFSTTGSVLFALFPVAGLPAIAFGDGKWEGQ